LDSSEHYHNASKKFAEHGINLDNLEVDMPQMVKRKNEVVSQTWDGVKFLMKKNKVDVYHGHGSFKDKNTILITKDDGSTEELSTDKTNIALSDSKIKASK
jgi:dihydrolipoamide dehydrogenase